MMRGVPFASSLLGVAGLIPFVYGVMLILSGPGVLPGFGIFAPTPDGGVKLLQDFGAIILGFMGGCLWGFASAPGRVPKLGILFASIIPAAIALFSMRPEPEMSCAGLAFGFAVLQGIDLWLHRRGVTPEYWISLRLPLTTGVILCLLVGALHG
ncbi:DUF3429 domain-containing protein [Amaricoccus tamworthensis]|uniref:DUF3429 domain-containing protein n=1 Tax=Amaricoccus tamworthensis TaxID=57002 RepID=UPI003C7C28B8